jgi:predicted HTH transcriptional regulator
MTLSRDQAYWIGLTLELLKLPSETTWVEFKHNNCNPDSIGEYISALSNAAALEDKTNGYLLWGVENSTHKLLGTTFLPSAASKGAEELESWLLRMLTPRIHFQFVTLEVDGLQVVLLEIPRAMNKPTQFSGQEWIRVGSNKKPLKGFPEKERELWRRFDLIPFEAILAANNLQGPEALALLDYPAYFDLLGLPLPDDRSALLSRLAGDELLVRNVAGLWDITNLGAILFAKDLNDFRTLARKSLRVVVYEGKGRIKTTRELEDRKGYASGFKGLIDYVNALLPRNEVIGAALRREVPMFPLLAVRELIANALIHQDFSISGAGPMVEIFIDRMEITNPGLPLMSTERFLDSPPRSRNEKLASFMRRVGICEERGSGVDKVVFETELYQLPAPSFETPENSTRAVLFAHMAFKDMDSRDRTRSCYLHACLRYVQRQPMTNSSLRERLGISLENSSMVSRVIKDSLAAELIKPFDIDQGRRHAKYLPFWA